MTNREPKPDFAIVRGNETASVNLPGDPDKGRSYARAEIDCYWIVNLIDRPIEVYDCPYGAVPDPKYGNGSIIAQARTFPLLGGTALMQCAVQDLLP